MEEEGGLKGLACYVFVLLGHVGDCCSFQFGDVFLGVGHGSEEFGAPTSLRSMERMRSLDLS